MKRLLLCLLTIAAVIPCLFAQETYDEFINQEGLKTYKGGFMTIYEVKGEDSLYFYAEIPERHLGRNFLVGSTVASTNDGDYHLVGSQSGVLDIYQLGKIDSTICFINPYPKVETKLKDPRLLRALERSYKPRAKKKFDIKYYNGDSTAYVISIGNFITETCSKGSSTQIKRVHSYEDNVTFELNQQVENLGMFGPFSFVVEEESDVNTTVSMLILPEEKMQPRFYDDYHRMAVQKTSVFSEELISTTKGFRENEVYCRWRINPVDTAAWLRGELTPVKKPIVLYMDDTMPEEWIEPAKRGALRWNKAFERIGLKEVIQVRDVPQNDSLFDLNDLKYSCIRYLPVDIANSAGQVWTDPTTGEILNASVLLFQGVVEEFYKMRFIQTAQIDPRIRCSEMPRDVFEETLEYVVAHEVGHILGLAHNFTASSAYPVDSLRSASFTREYGTTPSIMDYARFNYVAQPTDVGVTLTPPELGLYDYYAIEWLYKPHPEAKDGKEETRLANQLIDQHEGDPIYRFSYEESNDPTNIIEDLGDDHLKASDYGINNLKYIIGHLSEWSGETDSYVHRKMLYDELLKQRELYIMHVMSVIGGLQVTDRKDPQRIAHFLPVPRDQQRKALRWLFQQLRNSEWLDRPELLDIFDYELKASSVVPDDYKLLFDFIPRKIAITAHVDRSATPYTQREYFNDLYNELFRNTIAGRPLLNCEKRLQELAVEICSNSDVSNGYTHHSVNLNSLLKDEDIVQIDEQHKYRLWMLQRMRSLLQQVKQTAPTADRAHYAYLLKKVEEQLK